MKSPNICRIISDGIIILGIIIFSISLLAFGVEPIDPLSILAGTIPWGGYIYGLLTIRCPFCRRLLPWRTLWTSYCPHCGEDLEHC